MQRLLDLHVGRLDPSAAFTGSSPTLPQEWLVQFQEPASLFVKRIATSLGHVVYWDRSGFVSAEMGKGPVGNGTPVELRPGKNLLSIRVMHSVDGGPGQFRWTDPVRFTSRTFQGPRGNGASAGKPCSNRVSSLLEPPLVALPSEEIREWGTVVEVETTLPDPTLGAPLGLPSAWEAPNGETFRIERIEHSIDGRGTYRNRLWAVPESRWGMGGWRHPNHLLGPIPAEVTHNADPLKQGRIRVTLLEDPERRASPWIPGILPASGPETGFHWVPEIGQTVLVAAEAATPESLYLLGCVRGEKARIKSDWAQNDNSLKVLASRNGIRILMDDVKGILRMETPKSSIELRADGTIQLKGQELDLEMKGRASLVGKQGVVIDGSRIDLGV